MHLIQSLPRRHLFTLLTSDFSDSEMTAGVLGSLLGPPPGILPLSPVSPATLHFFSASPCLDLRVLLPRQPLHCCSHGRSVGGSTPSVLQGLVRWSPSTCSCLLTTLHQFAQHRTASFTVTIQIAFHNEKSHYFMSVCSTSGTLNAAFLILLLTILTTSIFTVASPS